MEERKTVEIVDEHGINRKATIMCGIDVDGTDYAVYSIGRDTDNDNLFVSKLIKDNDGTHKMVNIEDNLEKTKLTDIVKEMITASVNNENERVTGDITLSNGGKVQIISVLINKEQSINVTKTYITTVKKAVTKVGNDYYKVGDAKPEIESVLDGGVAVSETPAEPVAPILPEAPVSEAPAPELPVPEPLPEIPAEPVAPILPEAPTSEAPAPGMPVPEPISAVPLPEVPVKPVAPILPEAPVSEAPAPEMPVPEPIPAEPLPEAPAEPVAPILPEAPVSEAPAPEMPVPEPIPAEPLPEAPAEPVAPILPEAPASEAPAPGMPVFDASGEGNLNAALNEAGGSAIPVPNLEPVAEFGVDTPAQVPQQPSVQADAGPVLTKKAGFANNKFFMVIAVAFFLAACVFLGYEVFRYFSIVG